MPSRAPPVCVLERGQRGGAAFFYSITQGQEADNHLLLEKISKTAKKCLTKFSPGGIINKLIENSTIQDALVAQLDRVTGYEPVGRGFESLQARQTKRTLHLQCPFSFGALARAGVALCARLCGMQETSRWLVSERSSTGTFFDALHFKRAGTSRCVFIFMGN